MQPDAAAPDWGVKPDRPKGAGHHLQRLMVLLIFVAVAVGLTIALGPAFGFAPVLIINIGIGLAAFWWVNNQGLLALRAAKAMRCSSDQEPRFWNIAAGLADDLGTKPPHLFVVTEGGPNSLACI